MLYFTNPFLAVFFVFAASLFLSPLPVLVFHFVVMRPIGVWYFLSLDHYLPDFVAFYFFGYLVVYLADFPFGIALFGLDYLDFFVGYLDSFGSAYSVGPVGFVDSVDSVDFANFVGSVDFVVESIFSSHIQDYI